MGRVLTLTMAILLLLPAMAHAERTITISGTMEKSCIDNGAGQTCWKSVRQRPLTCNPVYYQAPCDPNFRISFKRVQVWVRADYDDTLAKATSSLRKGDVHFPYRTYGSGPNDCTGTMEIAADTALQTTVAPKVDGYRITDQLGWDWNDTMNQPSPYTKEWEDYYQTAWLKSDEVLGCFKIEYTLGLPQAGVDYFPGIYDTRQDDGGQPASYGKAKRIRWTGWGKAVSRGTGWQRTATGRMVRVRTLAFRPIRCEGKYRYSVVKVGQKVHRVRC